jgi:Bacterial dnaA protein helix-turn-helix
MTPDWTPQTAAPLRRERLARMSANPVPDTGIVSTRMCERSRAPSYGKRYVAKVFQAPPALKSGQLTAPPTPNYVTADAIVWCCCRYFGIGISKMKAAHRSRLTCHQRNITMHLIRDLTGMFHKDIGKMFGICLNTAMVFTNRVPMQIASDWTVAFDVAHIEAMLAADGYFLRERT